MEAVKLTTTNVSKMTFLPLITFLFSFFLIASRILFVCDEIKKGKFIYGRFFVDFKEFHFVINFHFFTVAFLCL